MNLAEQVSVESAVDAYGLVSRNWRTRSHGDCTNKSEWGFLFPTSPPALVAKCTTDICHSYRSGMKFQLFFSDVHYPNCYGWWAIWELLFSRFYFFFWELKHSSHSSTKNFSLKQKTIKGNHNQSRYKKQMIMGSLALTDSSTRQLLYLCFREQWREENGKIIRPRRPGKLLWDCRNDRGATSVIPLNNMFA